MQHGHSRIHPRRPAPRAFSLVELLTVIAIMVLLIAILVPAVNTVRITAREKTTLSTIGSLGTALETFRADQQVGGIYPPSAPDHMDGTQLTYSMRSPYQGLDGYSARYIRPAAGAGLLVWALAGADMLGTPGFRTFQDGSQYWADDTFATENGEGAYSLSSDTREPLRSRVAPFVDLSKIEVTKWNSELQVTGGNGSFELPIETEAADSLGIDAGMRERRLFPMFVDSFGGPMLYWRADPAGRMVADNSPTDSEVSGTNRNLRGIYHFRDNASLVDPTADNAAVLRLTASNKKHRLAFEYAAPVVPSDIQLNQPGTYNFAAYIRNKATEAKVTPARADSFLLISAGADGIFGTGDDIANFDHNGAELQEP